MPLYELFCISRSKVPIELTKNLMRKSALIVMTRGGVVRSLDNYGEQQLAYKMRKSQEWFNHGRQWVMTFDANPQTLLELNQQLKLDPMVIRHGVISMGSKLADKVPPLVSRDEVYASLVRQKTDY